MSAPPIRFDVGDAYERSMGVWSQLAGEIFLDWLRPASGLEWVDVGCGSGAFTELIAQRCSPASIHGIDPAEGLLAFARTRPAAQIATFGDGDAMALPFGDHRFDAAVMALVLFFVPDPPKSVMEMARVVRPGGIISAYLWDFEGGGFPFGPVQEALRAIALNPPMPSHPQVSRMDRLREIWSDAGLTDIETTVITVGRSFPSFDEFWSITSAGAGLQPMFQELSPAELDDVRARVRARLPPDAEGRIVYSGIANAIKGRTPI